MNWFTALVFVIFTLGLTANPVWSQERCEYEKVRVQSIKETIDVAGRAYRVEPCLIAAVIKAESNFRATAVSPRGAEGLMQLMPNTAAQLGLRSSFDPHGNVVAGTNYLRQMYDRFGSWRMALIAYNWGPGNLERYGADRMPRETRDYLVKVEKYYGKQIN